MKRLPTDREILRCIYEMYAAEYPGASKPQGGAENDPYLPINIHHVAGHLQCQPELVFGRLYYHLDAKYRYKQDNNAHVYFFQINLAGRRHCIHFPYMASVLATLDEEHKRFSWATAISIVALILSVAAIAAQVVTAK